MAPMICPHDIAEKLVRILTADGRVARLVDGQADVLDVDGLRCRVYVREVENGTGSLLLSILVPDRHEAFSDVELMKQYWLSPRQVQVARLLGERCTNKEIASRLGIRQNTVKTHVETVLRMMHVHSRLDVRDKLLRCRSG